MTQAFLGFVRGLVYPLVGYALFAITQYIGHSAFVSAPLALLLTGLIGKVEHQYNIPVYAGKNTGTPTPNDSAASQS